MGMDVDDPFHPLRLGLPSRLPRLKTWGVDGPLPFVPRVKIILAVYLISDAGRVFQLIVPAMTAALQSAGDGDG